MKRAELLALVFLCLSTGITSSASAETFGLVSSNLVEHPVVLSTDVRSASVWRGRAGAWGETFAEQTLRLRGFNEIHEFKTGSNGGFDRVAVKRGLSGSIVDVTFLEVKTSRGDTPKLGQTKYGGRQMSGRWLRKNLSKMARSGDSSMKVLAKDIKHYQRATGRTIESFGEVIHVNPRTGTLTGYMADGKTAKYSQPVDRLLRNIQKKASTQTARHWATRSLAEWDRISSSQMSSWLGQSTAGQSRASVLAKSLHLQNSVQRRVLDQSRRFVIRRTLVRAAGPMGAAIGVMMDAREVMQVELAYQRGQTSLRDRNIAHVTKAGGISGAFAGAAGLGATGAWLGAFGGPLAPITVPAGALIFGTVGGVGGYMAGSAVASYAATAWYDSIDSHIRDRFEREWLARRAPEFREMGPQ